MGTDRKSSHASEALGASHAPSAVRRIDVRQENAELHRDDIVLDGVLHQFGIGLQLQ